MTTVINPTIVKEEPIDVKREYDDDLSDEPESYFYVEKESRMIYEVRFFPEFVLIRPADPDSRSNLQRLDLLTFSKHFDEYGGDHQTIRDLLWGANLESIEVGKK